jgi:hypothetical protein
MPWLTAVQRQEKGQLTIFNLIGEENEKEHTI